MYRLLQFFIALLCITSAKAQTVYTTNTAFPSFTICPTSSISNAWCSNTIPFQGSLLKLSTVISGNQVTFKVVKCFSPYTFGQGGSTVTLYIKEDLTNTGVPASVVCGTSLPSSGTNITSLDTGSYTHTLNFSSGTKYYCAVVISQTGTTQTKYYSNVVAVTASQPPCSVPNNSSFTAINYSGTSFTAQWPSVSGTIGYNINYKLASSSSYGQFSPLYSSTNFVNITGLTSNTAYKFQVQAICSGNNTSQWSPSSTNTFTTNSSINYTLTVISPNGGQSYLTTQNCPVQWSSTGLSSADLVSIELCDASGNPQFQLPQTGINHQNSGLYNWYVPNTIPSGQYRIKIYKTGTTGGAYDLSDNTFTITNVSSTPSIVVTSPTLNQACTIGGSLSIGWQTNNISASQFMGIGVVNPSTKATILTLTPNVGVLNSNTYTWNNISGLPVGSYQIKVYQISNPSLLDYSATFTVSAGLPPSITVGYPNGGETFNTGQNINISWTSNYIGSQSVSIELVQGSNTNNYQVIASSIPNQSPYTWTIPSTIPTGQYRIKIYRTNTTTGTIVDYSNAVFTITNTPIPTCIAWSNNTPPTDYEQRVSAEYLCDGRIILNTQDAAANQLPIRRDDFATILYKGLIDTGSTYQSPVYYAHNPFTDLQATNGYKKYVIALAYLEYGDGVSVFKRSFSTFRPSQPIKRIDAVKAFVEAWNIPVFTNPSGASPFTDVPTTEPMYPWIKAAKDAGIINGSGGQFRPDDYLTRTEAFIILWRLLTNTAINKPTPTANDYFFSSTITPYNWNKSQGLENGNFGSYAKNSFSINGLVPLSFSHFYNSFETLLPDELYEVKTDNYQYKMRPLGVGWSHTYNVYLLKIDGDNTSSLTDDRVIIHWADGSFDSYVPAASNTFTKETYSNYDTLYYVGGDLEVKTKGQVKYRFQNKGNAKVWVLTKITDRNDNSLELQWSLQNSSPRLDKVVVSPSRYLQLNYNKLGENLITSVSAYTGSLVRTVYFDYSTDKTDLVSYTDAKNYSTTYTYGTSEKEKHLLKTITLPKGNVITNTYEQRKLKSTQYNGQYVAQVGFSQNYQNNNTVQTTVTTYNTPSGTGNPNQIAYTFDGLGNVATFTGALSNISATYNIPGQPHLPGTITNSVSGIQTVLDYDAMGNITKAQRNAPNLPSQIMKMHYNSFNDVDTVTDAIGNKTAYTYNTSGNLTHIRQPNNVTTTIAPWGNGLVASVTNPSGLTTVFDYDQYGNVKYAHVSGTSMSATATYDDAGRIKEMTDPNNVMAKLAYDNNDNVSWIKEDANNTGYTTSYDYDANDNTVKVTPPVGQPTILEYNFQSDLLEKETFGSFFKQFSYNVDGTLKIFKNKNGHTFNYTYFPSASTHAGMLQADGYAMYGYDSRHNLETITANSNGKIITIRHDGFNRPDSVHYNDATTNNTIKYRYNRNNLDSVIIYPNGLTVHYFYDALNRLDSMTDGSGYTFVNYDYLPDGRLDIEKFGNGTKTSYHYETGTARLDSMASLTSTNTVIAAYKFSFDNAGNHTQEIANIPNNIIVPPAATANTTYQPNSIDRQDKMGNINQGFNDNGAQTTLSGQPWASYDQRDNMQSYKHGSLIDTMEYDGLEGRRRRNNTRYVLDVLHGNNVLMETDLTGNHGSVYIYGLGLVCRIDADTPTAKYYYHYDYRGSTVAVTNSSQTVTHRYAYTSYGVLEAKQENGFANRYRYVGKYGVQYDDSALYFMRARYYNPYQGRFLSEDPIWHNNLYAYAGNNPVMNIDPSGLSYGQGSNYMEFTPSPSWDPNGILYHEPSLAPASTNWVQKQINRYNANSSSDNDAIGRAINSMHTPVGQYVVPMFAGLLISEVISILNTINKTVQYTKSTLQFGQQKHKVYKLGLDDGINTIKEFRLPSGKRIDFLDISNNTIYELKPFNPRAMHQGNWQLNEYMKELQTMPRFQDIQWKTFLDTY